MATNDRPMRKMQHNKGDEILFGYEPHEYQEGEEIELDGYVWLVKKIKDYYEKGEWEHEFNVLECTGVLATNGINLLSTLEDFVREIADGEYLDAPNCCRYQAQELLAEKDNSDE